MGLHGRSKADGIFSPSDGHLRSCQVVRLDFSLCLKDTTFRYYSSAVDHVTSSFVLHLSGFKG